MAAGAALCALYAATYVPAVTIPTEPIALALISIAWWLGASTMTLLYLWLCFDISLVDLLFRGVMGLALQEIVTIVLQYLIGRLLFPDLITRHTVAYVVLALAVYAVIEYAAYRFLAKKMAGTEAIAIKSEDQTIWPSVLTWMLLSLTTDLTSIIYVWATGEQVYGPSEVLNGLVIPGYCVLILVFICFIILVNRYSAYAVLQGRHEREMLEYLVREKQRQYEISEENIRVINQKAHDLKHLASYLKAEDGAANAQGTRKFLAEMGESVASYEAVVHTNNDALNTIVSEKGLLCTKYGIRFSCNMPYDELGMIDVIDLYTMLGNALDNAIECVRRYDDEKKRVISFSIQQVGQMINIRVENYCDDEVVFEDGFPVTRKDDKAYHGFGTKSINMLARKYGGDSMMSLENHVFSLFIMLPCA